MRKGHPAFPGRLLAAAAGILLLYGSNTVFLQVEVLLKLARSALGYGGWGWSGFSDVPTAWGTSTDLDSPARSLYAALTFHRPLLPWIARLRGPRFLEVLSALTTSSSTRRSSYLKPSW